MDHKKRKISNRLPRMKAEPIRATIPNELNAEKNITALLVNILEGKIHTNRFQVKQQTRIITVMNILLVNRIYILQLYKTNSE